VTARVARLTLALGGCAAEEAPRVELPVRVDCSRVTGAEATVTTDLGYAVTVTDARLALGGLVFTIAGEVHTASLMQRLSEACFVPRARAHPGHYQGGEVTGELPGDFALRCGQDQDRELGLATLIVGTYTAANFDLERGSDGAGPLYAKMTVWWATRCGSPGRPPGTRRASRSP
jgi:hypothetical protein